MDDRTAINLAIVAFLGFSLLIAGNLLNFPISINMKRAILSFICFIGILLMANQVKSGIDQYFESKKSSEAVDELVSYEKKLTSNLEKLSDNVSSINSLIDKKIKLLDSSIDAKIKSVNDALQKSEKDINDIMPYLSAIKNSIPIMSDKISGIPSKTASIMDRVNKYNNKKINLPPASVVPAWSPKNMLDSKVDFSAAEKMGIQEPIKPNM